MSNGLGTAVKSLRERAGVTQFGLAKAAKMDGTILSRLEAGKRQSIRFEYIVALAEALGVSLDDLAAEAGFMKSSASSLILPSADLARLEHRVASARRHLQRALVTLEL
jgi:transcriptional regulator with XRE-family HTH domain